MKKLHKIIRKNGSKFLEEDLNISQELIIILSHNYIEISEAQISRIEKLLEKRNIYLVS